MRVIKDQVVLEDDWVLLRELADLASVPPEYAILPLAYWQANRNTLIKSKLQYGVWIDGAVATESLLEDIKHFAIIALDFPTFKDGRSYSHARLLRDRYAYQGDIRAIGDVLRDQLFFMQRCGISSYQVRADKDIVDALKGLSSFSVRYQAAADDGVPIYQSRQSS